MACGPALRGRLSAIRLVARTRLTEGPSVVPKHLCHPTDHFSDSPFRGPVTCPTALKTSRSLKPAMNANA